MASGYADLKNELVRAPNGVDYAYRDTGGGGADAVPLAASRGPTHRCARAAAHRTRVEWHLRKVFIKLGISSRRQLRTALTPPGRDGQPA